MAGKGGKRKGAGRKSKVEEEKVNTIFLTALKELYKVDKDDDAKVKFVHSLLDSQRGQLFVAEHIFGKPKDVIENTHNIKENFDLKKLLNFVCFSLWTCNITHLERKKRTVWVQNYSANIFEDFLNTFCNSGRIWASVTRPNDSYLCC